MFRYIRQVIRDGRDRGASAVEYGLMVAAIAAVIVGIVFGLGSVMKGVLGGACDSIQGNAKVTTASCATGGTTPQPSANTGN